MLSIISRYFTAINYKNCIFYLIVIIIFFEINYHFYQKRAKKFSIKDIIKDDSILQKTVTFLSDKGIRSEGNNE